jgi:hypothetical protein
MALNKPSVIICAIALNEDLYVEEWIQHHLKIGFDHIFIYDNSLTNTLQHIGGLYNGLVTIIHFPGKMCQVPAYEKQAIMLRNTHAWCAFIDLDEFIVLRKHLCIRDLITEICPLGGALVLNWVFFGSNGQENYSPMPVVKRFTRRAKEINRHIKTIAYIPHIASFEGCHAVRLKGGVLPQDCHGHRVSGPFNDGGSEDVACIYHYFTKSKEEYILKMQRGKADALDIRSLAEFDAHDFNEINDMTLA